MVKCVLQLGGQGVTLRFFVVVSLMPVMSTRSRGIQNGKINKTNFETSPPSEREMDRERERGHNTLHPNPKGNGKGKDVSSHHLPSRKGNENGKEKESKAYNHHLPIRNGHGQEKEDTL